MAIQQAPEQAVARIEEILAAGGQCRLWVTGTSMVPFLRHGKDAVILTAMVQPPRRGDLLFYRRRGGQVILHRIHRLCPDGTFLLCGDNQVGLEPVAPGQVIGCVHAIERQGKQLSPRNLLWRSLSHIWMGLYFMRPPLLKLMHWLWKKLKG